MARRYLKQFMNMQQDNNHVIANKQDSKTQLSGYI